MEPPSELSYCHSRRVRGSGGNRDESCAVQLSSDEDEELREREGRLEWMERWNSECCPPAAIKRSLESGRDSEAKVLGVNVSSTSVVDV